MLQDICCIHRSPAASQEDEEAEEGNSLSKHGRELQRLLKTTGLSDSDDDPSNEVNLAHFKYLVCPNNLKIGVHFTMET